MLYHLVALYQNTSNYGPGVEISPMLLVLGFHIEIKKEIFKNLLVPNRKGWSFHIWHVASSSPMLLVLGFHLEIKKEIFKNLLVPNHKG